MHVKSANYVVVDLGCNKVGLTSLRKGWDPEKIENLVIVQLNMNLLKEIGKIM